jgi:hypothetical protein
MYTHTHTHTQYIYIRALFVIECLPPFRTPLRVHARSSRFTHSTKPFITHNTYTHTGDPPNIMIGNLLAEYLDFNDFLFNLGPGILLASPPVFLFLKWYMNM